MFNNQGNSKPEASQKENGDMAWACCEELVELDDVQLATVGGGVSAVSAVRGGGVSAVSAVGVVGVGTLPPLTLSQLVWYQAMINSINRGGILAVPAIRR